MTTVNKLEMTTQPLVVKRGEGETIQSLGSALTFLRRQVGAWSLTQVSAPRGTGAPLHDHDFDESYYMLSGSLAFTLDGTELVLEAGDFAHIPGGTVHGFKAISETPALFLTLQSPGDADEFFRACAREIKKLPDDLARVPELGARYGIRTACTVPARAPGL